MTNDVDNKDKQDELPEKVVSYVNSKIIKYKRDGRN